MDELKLLELFTSGHEETSRRAFEGLCRLARPFLHTSLRRVGMTEDEDRRAVIEDTLAKVWEARNRFTPQGVGAWYVYLQRSARRTRIDVIRNVKEEGSLDDRLEVLVSDERPVLDQVLAAIDRDRLFDAADRLWLGFGDLPREERNLRLLAAQYVLIDGVPPDEAVHLLPAFSRSRRRTSTDIANWIEDPAVLRALAYVELYFDADRLVRHLIGFPECDDGLTCGATALDDLERGAMSQGNDTVFGEFTSTELIVAFLRYRHCLPVESAEQRNRYPVDPPILDEILDRFASRWPFIPVMEQLLDRLEARHGKPFSVQRRSALADPGLWHRLAFEYRLADDMPVKDILERVAPPAGLVDYAITAAMLNVWLSGGRLIGRLITYCGEELRDGRKVG